MAHDAPQATGPSKLVIRNIGLMLTGALEKPILDADTIVADDGRITAIGRYKDVDTEGATTIVDANGTTVGARMDLKDKVKALELLGKYHKLFTDRVETSAPVLKALIGIDLDAI